MLHAIFRCLTKAHLDKDYILIQKISNSVFQIWTVITENNSLWIFWILDIAKILELLINRYISGASKTFTREMACCTPFISIYVTATCISMSTTILEIILKLLYSHTLSINSGIYVQVRHFGYRVYLIQVGKHFSSMRFWTGTKNQSCIYSTHIDKKPRVSRILQK